MPCRSRRVTGVLNFRQALASPHPGLHSRSERDRFSPVCGCERRVGPVIESHNCGPRQRIAESALACRVAKRPDLGARSAPKRHWLTGLRLCGISRVEPLTGFQGLDYEDGITTVDRAL